MECDEETTDVEEEDEKGKAVIEDTDNLLITLAEYKRLLVTFEKKNKTKN